MNRNFFRKLNKTFQEILSTQLDNIKCIFIHGSVAEKKESWGSYREERYYFKNHFVFSNFTFRNQPPDVDIIIITDSVKEVLSCAKKNIREMPQNYFITINFISSREYAYLLTLAESTAPKVILLFKKTIVLYGEEYFKQLRKVALANKNTKDIQYHNQFMALKRIKSENSKNKDKGLKSFVINRAQYREQFPLFLDILEGKAIGGFSINRVKYIYPRSMRLKERIDIDKRKRTFLE